MSVSSIITTIDMIILDFLPILQNTIINQSLQLHYLLDYTNYNLLLHDFKVNQSFVKPCWRNTLFSPSCCCAHFSAFNKAVAAMFKQQAFFVVRNRQSPKNVAA